MSDELAPCIGYSIVNGSQCVRIEYPSAVVTKRQKDRGDTWDWMLEFRIAPHGALYTRPATIATYEKQHLFEHGKEIMIARAYALGQQFLADQKLGRKRAAR